MRGSNFYVSVALDIVTHPLLHALLVFVAGVLIGKALL
jgi:hypothetical protein